MDRGLSLSDSLGLGVLSCGSAVCDCRLPCVMVMGSSDEMLRMYGTVLEDIVGHNPSKDEKVPGRKRFFFFFSRLVRMQFQGSTPHLPYD